jgi:hypothetical protein
MERTWLLMAERAASSDFVRRDSSSVLRQIAALHGEMDRYVKAESLFARCIRMSSVQKRRLSVIMHAILRTGRGI